jgi:hypothetical protein
MSFVFNTNIARSGIDWRLFSPQYTSKYQTAINQNVGKIFTPTASLVSSPFSHAAAVNSVVLSNGNLLCSGFEGLYAFNPVTLQFTYRSNNTYLEKMCLLDDGNILCTQGLSNIAVINPNNGSYIRSGDLTIIANQIISGDSLTITSGPQTIVVSTSDAPRFISGAIINATGDLISFTGTIISTTSNSITISKTTQSGTGTGSFWTINIIGQTTSALNTFKSSILNFQKIPITQDRLSRSFYVLTNSSFDRDAYIDTLNWTISFDAKAKNTLYKSSSKYLADTSSSEIKFPESSYSKIISTRSTNAYAMSNDSNSLKLVHPGGNITNSSTQNVNNIFCLLPQIDSQATNQAQGRILLWVAGGQYQVWNTVNNTIQTASVSGSAPDEYRQPVQLLDGRIFLIPMPNNSNPSSFLIFGGGGGFNPNVTLSPYFNKFN